METSAGERASSVKSEQSDDMEDIEQNLRALTLSPTEQEVRRQSTPVTTGKRLRRMDQKTPPPSPPNPQIAKKSPQNETGRIRTWDAHDGVYRCFACEWEWDGCVCTSAASKCNQISMAPEFQEEDNSTDWSEASDWSARDDSDFVDNTPASKESDGWSAESEDDDPSNGEAVDALLPPQTPRRSKTLEQKGAVKPKSTAKMKVKDILSSSTSAFGISFAQFSRLRKKVRTYPKRTRE